MRLSGVIFSPEAPTWLLYIQEALKGDILKGDIWKWDFALKFALENGISLCTSHSTRQFSLNFARGVARTVSLPISSVFFPFSSFFPLSSVFFRFCLFSVFVVFWGVPIFSVFFFFRFLPFSSVFFRFLPFHFQKKKKKKPGDTVCETLFAKPRLLAQKYPQYCWELHDDSSERPLFRTISEKRGIPGRTEGVRILDSCSGSLKCLELEGLGDSSRARKKNSRKRSESVSGPRIRGLSEKFPEFFPEVLGCFSWRCVRMNVCSAILLQDYCSFGIDM